MPDVSALIVNYNSGAYTSQLVDCLEAQSVRAPDGGPGELEVVVVENGSPDDQEHWMAPLEERGVRVVRSAQNLGYAGGCNQAVRVARGRNLLFLNPDVFLLPGAVEALSTYLDEHPDAGQVGPRGWFDCHRYFHLPRIELPTLSLHLTEAWRGTSPARAARFALRRTRHALRIWSAQLPQEEPVLAGFAFMMPAELARRLGPFDTDYPLYFEDSDLTRRVRQSGHRCVLVPAAETVHLYNKSAGQFQEEALRKHALSQRLYYRKHYGPLGSWLAEHGPGWITRCFPVRDNRYFLDPVDLGPRDAPPVFELSRPAERYVMELTLDPLFTLAVGRIDTASRLQIPHGVWQHLDPTRYFVRALALPTLEPLGAWSFAKTTPCHPVAGFADFCARLEGSHQPPGLVV